MERKNHPFCQAYGRLHARLRTNEGEPWPKNSLHDYCRLFQVTYLLYFICTFYSVILQSVHLFSPGPNTESRLLRRVDFSGVRRKRIAGGGEGERRIREHGEVIFD